MVVRSWLNKIRELTQILHVSAIAMLCLMGNAKAKEIELYESTRYYTVELNNGQSLREAIKDRSPIKRLGKTFFAQTQWTVEPQFALQKWAGLCRLQHLSVDLRVRFILPKLQQNENTPSAVVAQFDKFYHSLLRHEHGHRDIAMEAAQAVHNRLEKIPPNLDCQSLQARVKRKYHEILAHYTQLNADYDQRTDFGRTQGAVIGDAVVSP